MQFRHQIDKNKEQIIKPGLYLISTPIGNMQDITFRALTILKKSDIILCEDTRTSKKLLSYFEIKNKLLSYHKFNEKRVTNEIINLMEKNKIVSLVSDAGTPVISDPGMLIVNECINQNILVYPIPGPSAVTAAVSVSGFSDSYLFCGFLKKKGSKLNNLLKGLMNFEYSIVFFIPSKKINFYLSQFKIFFSDRKILIAREMTKIYEEFIRGKVKSIKSLPENLKGELTVVLSEKIKYKNDKKKINESVTLEIKKMLKKYSHKDVVEFISKKENLSKKIVYEFCLKLRK